MRILGRKDCSEKVQ